MSETKGKYLVIVESPSKAKTINKYLGNNYIVTSSVGHIRELKYPEHDKGKGSTKVPSLVKSMGVNPYTGNWETWYGTIEGKQKVVKEILFLAKNAPKIYLATDLDREGEAIAWHLQEIISKELGFTEDRFERVTFNEITKEAIQKAFETPRKLDMNLVQAQRARQVLDKVVGYTVSPILWKKIARGLSAGRVQSAALRLLVEREDAIRAFVPDMYYDVKSVVENAKQQSITLSLYRQNGRPVDQTFLQSLVDEQAKQTLQQALETNPYKVLEVTTKPTTSKPSAPFTTSTLQQSASSRLGYGVKKTMQLAQKLYEQGYITYMRTDSTAISDEALSSVRGYIGSKYGNNYLSDKPVIYQNHVNAQEAHECIRPSKIDLTSNDLSNVDDQAMKLYDLIRRRFIACQMSPAKYDSTSILVGVDNYEMRAKGRVVIFDGFTKVLKSKSTDEDQELPTVKEGEVLKFNELLLEKKYTQPPARFNEASLVKELEKMGIGRPSTYATIITTLQDRGYARVDKRRFYVEKIGTIVEDRLAQSFSELINYNYTALIERELDAVAHGNLTFLEVLNNFWNQHSQRLEVADKPMEEGGMKNKLPILTPIKCSNCLRQLAVRYNQNSLPFLGCIGFTDKENQCKHIENLTDVTVKPKDEDEEVLQLRNGKRCACCNFLMESYLLDKKRKLHLCTNTGRCEYFELEEGEFELPRTAEGPACDCEKCGQFMVLKTGKFGKYMNCPHCGNNRRILPNGEVAPPRQEAVAYPELKCSKKGSYFVLREGKNGLFFAAHNFPKVREIRTPLVTELVKYKERLPEKFKFILTAPEFDDFGVPTEIKFSEKEGWYVRVFNKELKRNSFKRIFKDNEWVEA